MGKILITRHECPICGVVFQGPEARLYCSIKCKRRAAIIIRMAEKMRLQEEQHEREQKHAQEPEPAEAVYCEYCDTRIWHPEPGQKYCCESCKRLDEMTTPKRKCHDCGKPCVGYRCNLCNARFRGIYDG